MSYVIVWVPMSQDGRQRPHFMEEGDGETVSLFESEDDAAAAAEKTPAANVWPYVVVELP